MIANVDKIENNNNKYINRYIGKFFLPTIQPNYLYEKIVLYKREKVIVLDLDETLGCFGDLFLLWSGIIHIYPEFQDLNLLLDLYPEFLRYGILHILEFICCKKKSKECSKVYLYTNNQCSPEWATLITNYFNYKLHLSFSLFDKIINAFKIRNKRIEMNRTTSKKTFSDLIRCTLLPKETEVCFIDNSEYEKMKHDAVYYIQPKSYLHSLSVKEIIQRWICSSLCNSELFLLHSESYWFDWFSMHGRNGVLCDPKNIELHILVSQKIMYYIKEFFWFSNNNNRQKTKKKKTLKLKRKTRKIHHSH